MTTTRMFNKQAQKPVTTSSKHPAPFCLRLSHEERMILEKAAGDKPLGTYIRSCLFTEAVTKRRKSRRASSPQQKVIAQLFAALGQKRIPQNIAQLAQAAQDNPHHFTVDLCTVLTSAHQDVKTIRMMLVKASGKRFSTSLSHAALQQVLERFDALKVCDDINAIAKAIHVDAFILSSEIEALISTFCADLHQISVMLTDIVGE